jgi:phospholipase/carboxylesterase
LNSLNAVVIEPSQSVTASVIWLHGLGADGHDFEPIVPELSHNLRQHTRFIFPNAPKRPVTINGGMVMPAWYDIVAQNLTKWQDEQGIRASEKIVHNFISNEVRRGIDTQHIVLAGFSQGGAIAVHTGLRYFTPLAGIMVLSAYLPLENTAENEKHESNEKTPIFMAHGQFDPVIPIAQAQHSRAVLVKMGYAVEWHDYFMEHSVNSQEISDIERWLSHRLLK